MYRTKTEHKLSEDFIKHLSATMTGHMMMMSYRQTSKQSSPLSPTEALLVPFLRALGPCDLLLKVQPTLGLWGVLHALDHW